MRKSSKKKSNRISAIILLPIIAVIIAVPVILTILVDAPVSGTKSPAGTSVTTDISVSGGSDDPDSGGVSADSGSLNPNGMSADSVNPNPNNISVGSDESGSGSISAEPNAPDTLHSDSSESLDFPSSSTEAPADIGTDSAELHSSRLPAMQTSLHRHARLTTFPLTPADFIPQLTIMFLFLQTQTAHRNPLNAIPC